MEYEAALDMEAIPTLKRDVPVPISEYTFPQHISLAMAYVPYQPFENLYDGDMALERGTFFKALDMPFMGGKDRKK